MTPEYKGPLPGTYWIVPQRLLGGPYPARAATGEEQQALETLLATGITRFFDLTEAHELPPYSAQLPGGVGHERWPIPDMSTPSPARMTAILDALDRAVEQNHVVYLHCWGGVGRTGTVAGCYLVRHGLAGQTALDTIAARLHSGSPETDEQRAMIRTWAQWERRA